jgi:hypothetical protein
MDTTIKKADIKAAFRIRKFFGLPDMDPLLRGTNPDLPLSSKNSKKPFNSTVL